MRMLLKQGIVVVVAAGGLLLLAGSGEAAETARPGSVLKKAAKNLVRSRSYRVSLEVSGGVSTSRNHELSRCTYRGSWQGDVYRRVMRLDGEKAFRTPSSGAFFNAKRGVWGSIFASSKGTEIHRLFAFPEVVLAQALRHARTAQWMTTSRSDDSPEPSNVTVERAGQDSGAPTRIRVVAPQIEAAKRFTEIQNSGCVSGG